MPGRDFHDIVNEPRTISIRLPGRRPGGSHRERPAAKSTKDCFRFGLREILRRGREIMAGDRLVGGPRAVAFDLAGVAGKALSEETPVQRQ
jgi:hypothetical protein